MSALIVMGCLTLVALGCGVVDTLRERAMIGRVIADLIANPVKRNR